MESPSKKRKRDVRLQIVPSDKAELGPALVTYSAVVPPSDTSFRALKSTPPAGDPLKPFTFVKGESESVEFESIAGNGSATNQTCQYMLGIYDKDNSVIRLHAAPHYVVAHSVKRVKALTYSTSPSLTTGQQKHELSEAFGAAKAVKAARQAQRNQVDLSAVENVTHLQQTVDARTASLPTEEEHRKVSNEHMPFPRANLHASIPGEVYNLDDIALPEELKSFDVKPILSAHTNADRAQLLPYLSSIWARDCLQTLFGAGAPDESTLREFMFACSMMAFRSHFLQKVGFGRRKIGAILEEQHGIPSLVIHGLLDRFTEQSESRRMLTSTMGIRLTSHLLALCLRLNRYTLPLEALSLDLALDYPKLRGFMMGLGCRFTLNKQAVLSLPLSKGINQRSRKSRSRR
ncbi:RNA polymerase I associated factor, A49-like protein [Cantharellus anzutake]|uniref:RNA polymerase I associated factor, A49-like protein n=1 Tax=Cantharellus anzutake TaxID=1750568 RepID=UPI0019053848|nr:RNA polymerase I associated factor, A49-like protein [Cantharellus anzutake]KAF8332014.1 RNA polymerase I associated factor, A49-like protein [Cantharellus anzutake]